MVTTTSLVILHGGVGPDVELLAYLTRVLIHVVAFGGVAGLAFLGARVTGAVRSALAADPDGAATER